MDAEFFMSYPHDVYARLRDEAPVYYSERDSIWAITKYDDVRTISKTPELFANGYHIFVTAAKTEDDGVPRRMPDAPRRAELRRQEARGPTDSDSVVMADGERHDFLRKIASYAFTPRRSRSSSSRSKSSGRALRRDRARDRGRLRQHHRRAVADDHDRPDARSSHGGP